MCPVEIGDGLAGFSYLQQIQAQEQIGGKEPWFLMQGSTKLGDRRCIIAKQMMHQSQIGANFRRMGLGL